MTDTPTRRSVQTRVEGHLRVAMAALIVMIVLAMYPFTNDPTGDIKRLLTCWGAAVLGLWWLLAAWRNGFVVRRPRVALEVLLCLLLLLALATLRSDFRWVSLVELGGFTFLAVLYLVSSQIYRKPEQVQQLMLVICCAVGLSTLYGFAQSIGLDPFPWEDRTSEAYQGLPATFGNPNYAGHTLILVIIMSVFLGVTGLSRRWAVLFAGIFLFHLYRTDHRAGIVALAAAAALVVVAWLLRGLPGRPGKRALISFVTAVALGAAGAVGALSLSQWRTGSPFPLDSSILLRYHAYVSASKMILDNPVLGHGPAVYGMTCPAYWTEYEQEFFAQEVRMNEHVHNDPLELAIDAGLPAAGCYLAILILAAAAGLALAYGATNPLRRRLGYTFAALFMAFLIDGLFGFNLRVPVSAAIFFVLLGALEGLWAADAPTQKKTSVSLKLCALSALSVVLVLAAVHTRVFASKSWMQEGMRQQYTAIEAQKGGHGSHASEAFDNADQAFKRGWMLAPWNAFFPQRLAQVRLGQRQPAEAIRLYETALELDPYYILNYLPLAELQMLEARQSLKEDPEGLAEALDALDAAAAHVNRLVAFCPTYPAAHEQLGRIASLSALYLEQAEGGDPGRLTAYWKSAEHHLLEAIRYQQPNQADLYRMLAKVRLALDDIDGAEEALTRSVTADPGNDALWRFYLQFAGSHDRFAGLRKVVESRISRLLAKESPDVDALATIYLIQARVLETGFDDLEGADGAYMKAVENAPRRIDVWANLAHYAESRQRSYLLQRSVVESCAAVEECGERPLGYVAGVAGVMRNGAEALEAGSTVLLSHVRAYRPQRAVPAAQAFGWAAQAMLENAVRAPDDTPGIDTAFLNLAMVYAGMDQLPLAENLYRQAQRRLPRERHDVLAIHYADALVRLKRGAEALGLLRNAHERFPESLDVHMALARSLAREGRLEEARVEYEALLELDDLSPQGRTLIQKEFEAL